MKTCMPIYSQEVGTLFGWKSVDNDNPTEADFIQNGKYCETGLAYPVNKDTARCTDFKEMTFDDKVTNQPFACNPSDQSKMCKLYFNIEAEDEEYTKKNNRFFVENKCKCALKPGQPELGYCSSVIGTKKYQRSLKAMRYVMENSKCHTLDRNNIFAQKDNSCGIGIKTEDNDEWRFAVD